MIEAVNSLIANAQVVRGTAAQTDPAHAYAANPDKVQETATVVGASAEQSTVGVTETASAGQAPYVSPRVVVDIRYKKPILEFRNGQTGDVEHQFPTEFALELQARQEANSQKASATSKAKAEELLQQLEPVKKIVSSEAQAAVSAYAKAGQTSTGTDSAT